MIDLRKRTRCLDCGLDVTASGDYCMLLDRVWAATGLGPDDGVLCLADIERRLGRRLRREDFVPTSDENRDAWGWRERMYPSGWPGTEPEQLTLPLALPEQHRIYDPWPEALVRQFLRAKQ